MSKVRVKIVGAYLVEEFEAKSGFLTFFSTVEARASDDAAHSQEGDYESHGDSHGCVHVIFHELQLEVADAAEEQSRSEQRRAANPMQPHVHLPPVLEIAIRAHLEQAKEGPGRPQEVSVDQIETHCHEVF